MPLVINLGHFYRSDVARLEQAKINRALRTKQRMRGRTTNFSKSHAKRLFEAAVAAGVDVRVEFRPDGLAGGGEDHQSRRLSANQLRPVGTCDVRSSG